MPAKSTASVLPFEVPRAETPAGEFIEFPTVPHNSPIKPNKQYYVEVLAEGTMVGIHELRLYPTFFKLFARYNGYHKLKLKLYVRQVKADLWVLIARKASEPKPGSMIDGDFREHGKYKWYAEQLNKGETVELENETEARKARRAWMLYTPSEQRGQLEAVVERKGKKYLVSVVGL